MEVGARAKVGVRARVRKGMGASVRDGLGSAATAHLESDIVHRVGREVTRRHDAAMAAARVAA